MNIFSISIYTSLLLVTLTILILSCNKFLDITKKIAAEFKIPRFYFGIFILSVGTCLPELVGLFTISNNYDYTYIISSSIIGTNITALSLLVGLMAVFFKKIVIEKNYRNDFIMFFTIIAIFFITIYDRYIIKPEGFILITLILGVLFYMYKKAKFQKKLITINKEKITKKEYYILAGCVLGFILFGNVIVFCIKNLSILLNDAYPYYAITLIAIFYSIPEFIFCYNSLKQKNTDTFLGCILGSCVFNILFVLGFSAIKQPIFVTYKTFYYGLLFTVLSSFILYYYFINKKELDTKAGIFLILVYINFFVFYLF